MTSSTGLVVTNSDGECVSMKTVPLFDIVYVNRLAMKILDTPELGFSTEYTTRVLGKKSVIEATMRSMTRIKLPRQR